MTAKALPVHPQPGGPFSRGSPEYTEAVARWIW